MKKLFFFILLFSFSACDISLAPINPNQEQNQDDNGDRDSRDRDDNRSVRIHPDEKEVHRLVNEYRRRNGRAPLKQIDQAILEAQYHSVDLERYDDLNHDGLRTRVNSIADREDVDIRAFAENVGYNSTSQSMVNGWISSLGHRRNMLGNYTHTGIGRSGSGNKIFFTQIFLRISN